MLRINYTKEDLIAKFEEAKLLYRQAQWKKAIIAFTDFDVCILNTPKMKDRFGYYAYHGMLRESQFNAADCYRQMAIKLLDKGEISEACVPFVFFLRCIELFKVKSWDLYCDKLALSYRDLYVVLLAEAEKLPPDAKDNPLPGLRNLESKLASVLAKGQENKAEFEAQQKIDSQTVADNPNTVFGNTKLVEMEEVTKFKSQMNQSKS